MPKQSDLLLTERELAERTGIKPATLQDWRYRGFGPPYLRISARCIRYDWGEVSTWLDAHRVAGGAR